MTNLNSFFVRIITPLAEWVVFIKHTGRCCKIIIFFYKCYYWETFLNTPTSKNNHIQGDLSRMDLTLFPLYSRTKYFSCVCVSIDLDIASDWLVETRIYRVKWMIVRFCLFCVILSETKLPSRYGRIRKKSIMHVCKHY